MNEVDVLSSNLIEDKSEGEAFYIVGCNRDIEKIMSIQGINDTDNRVCYRCKQLIANCHCEDGTHSPYYEKINTLDLEHLLGLFESEWIYPITESDMTNIKTRLEIQSLIDNGQLYLDDSMTINHDEWLENHHTSMDVLKSILQHYDEYDHDLDELNEWIKDNIPAIEYGYSDEYALCSECGYNSFRISPDSNGWKRTYFETEYGYMCCLIFFSFVIYHL